MEVQFVSQENTRRHESIYPAAAETVLKSTYMHDSLDSVESKHHGIVKRPLGTCRYESQKMDFEFT